MYSSGGNGSMQYGFMGTGLMGFPMAQQICQAGLPLMVYNRTLAKAQPLVAEGATLATSAQDLVEASDCLIVMLTDTQAIRDLLLVDPVRTQLAGRTVIQMGTIGPQESRDLKAELESLEGEYLECPVLGSIPEAKRGSLIVMVGSTPAQFQRWQSLLERFGPEPQWVGPVGTAMALKLGLNQLIGSLTAAFSLSLGFVRRQGVEIDQFMQVLRNSALYAPTFDKKLQRMQDRQFENPNFPSKHLAKDIRLFLQAAEQIGLQTDSLVGVERILTQTLATGMADLDYSSLYTTIDPESEPGESTP